MAEEFLALPLRIREDGQLARTDAVGALLGLFHAMAATPAGSWKHARWFGLQEYFAGANLLLQDQQPLADALNLALRELGIGWAQVVSVTTSPQRPGERGFQIALSIEGGQTVHRTLPL